MFNNPTLSLKRRFQSFLSQVDQTNFWKGLALILFALIVLTQSVDIQVTPKSGLLRKLLIPSSPVQPTSASSAPVDTASLTQAVLPEAGISLPINWGNLGQKLIADGVIDEAKFRALFDGGLTNVEEQMLSGNLDQSVVLTQQNSRYLLDLFWAFGLANKNDILETGEMVDPQYGGAGNFASTGGWSIAQGAGIDHYSQHPYVVLTPQQQALVDSVSRGIYRPCCGNSTHFPDCNHGLAMLGLLQLMAAQNVGEADMYRIALQVNSYWFPQTYIDLATYFQEQGQDWSGVDPQLALSAEYSSARGYQQTRSKIQSLPKPGQGGGSCGT